jgi:ATP-dependent Clp protease ATP-binding subunit ClpA
VFERFDEDARQVVVLAQDEARALKHNYIGTEHLLLGLLREDRGVAAQTLEAFDITVEEVRADIARIVGQGDEIHDGQIPFTPRAKKVLELSLREALTLGHNYIGTEHILLGVAAENEGVAARILLNFDVGPEKIRSEVLRAMSGAGPSAGENAVDADAFYDVTQSTSPVAAYSPMQSRPRISVSSSSYGSMPWWQPIAVRTDLWLGLVVGALILGAGILVGWLIWG